MAEENKEVVEETTEKQNEEKIDKSKFDSAEDDSVVKVDLSKPPTKKSEEVEQQPAEEEKVVVVNEESDTTKEEEVVEEKTPILEEVTDEEITEDNIEGVKEKIEEAVAEAEVTGKPLPESIQKLVDFMEETGGDINDYVNLNRDVSKMDNSDILDEYYRTTKSHLTAEERAFLLEESFGYNEEEDDPKDIRKKKIALKEQVAEAKAYLDGQKSKYYQDIKAGSKLTQEQQKAIDFFDRYNKDSKNQEKLFEANKKKFQQRTDNVFNKDFKGFDYQVGEKKYRFNVKDVDNVRTTQSDINNFINKFVGEDSSISDAKGYHKSLFTAMNADAIANHFYEQGKADAIKDRVAKDKNINLEPRKTHGETNVGGVKYRVLGNTSTEIKNRSFKIRKKN